MPWVSAGGEKVSPWVTTDTGRFIYCYIWWNAWMSLDQLQVSKLEGTNGMCILIYKTPNSIWHSLCSIANVNLQFCTENTQCECESSSSQQGYCNHLCHTRTPVIFSMLMETSHFHACAVCQICLMGCTSLTISIIPCLYIHIIQFWSLKSN